ncbi:MAG: hypothetical protein ABI925_02660 [Verrucomicrobiota bacterium]
MRSVFTPRPEYTSGPLTLDRSKRVRKVFWLIVAYIFLLIIEGALRKWVVPRLSNPLLIIRDPVLILIYFMAFRAGVFPRNGFVMSLAVIGFLSVVLSIYVLGDYVTSLPLWITVIYGFRSNFFHLPLIFLMANVFDEGDVKRIGWWILLGMIPMGLLMVAQFQASPDSFINGTAGMVEGAEQLTAGGGKIRPAGTFSFISGPIFYCTASAAFLLYGILSRGTYRIWILIPSGIALVVAAGVSGSRACVVSVLLVVATVLVIFIVRPQAVNQYGRLLLIGIIAIFVISRLPVFKEGVDVLSERFVASAEAEETGMMRGLLARTTEGFTESLTNIDKFPAGGWGLGIGTNVGAHFLVGGPAFILSENEWTRVLYESGPILGLAFLLWRTILTFRVGYLSLVALRRGSTLPILLFSSAFFVLLNGQFGQPTSLGFAVVLTGLCLASMQKTKQDAEALSENDAIARGPAPRPIPRSSPFASRLHDPPPQTDQTNGVVDR